MKLSAQREVSLLEWDGRAQMVTGRSQEAKEINNNLAMLKARLLNCHSKLEVRSVTITAETLKNEFTGVVEKPRLLLPIIQQHNDDIKKLIGKDYSKATWIKYNTTLKHITEFLKWKYNLSDINLKGLNFEFITNFEFYLKSEKSIDVNTNAKYIKNLKKIIKECVCKDWLQKDPFMAYKIKAKKTERKFLTDLELQSIQEKHFTIKRLSHVKDIFLFS